MSWQLIKFPRTPHFPGSTGAELKSERVLSLSDVERMLREPVIVEEKVDGANLGISFDDEGRPILQSRGSVIEAGRTAAQFAPVYAWLAGRQGALFAALGTRLTLFGEWLYARHSVSYDALPDFFLAFDLLERDARSFLTVVRRAEICAQCGVVEVPILFKGVLGSASSIQKLLLRSRLGSGATEGVYLRLEKAGCLELRAKYVREGWVLPDEIHWSKRSLERNHLVR